MSDPKKCSACIDGDHGRCTGNRKEWDRKLRKHVLVRCKCLHEEKP